MFGLILDIRNDYLENMYVVDNLDKDYIDCFPNFFREKVIEFEEYTL